MESSLWLCVFTSSQRAVDRDFTTPSRSCIFAMFLRKRNIYEYINSMKGSEKGKQTEKEGKKKRGTK